MESSVIKYPKLNEPLIQKVLAHIKTDNFIRYEQDIIGVVLTDLDGQLHFIKNNPTLSSGDRFPECGAKACFGGWSVLLTTPKNRWNTLIMSNGEMKSNTLDIAQQRLGLTDQEAEYLFETSSTRSSEEDYEVIKSRVAEIRRVRKLAIKCEALFKEVSALGDQLRVASKKANTKLEALAQVVEDMRSEILDEELLVEFENLRDKIT